MDTLETEVKRWTAKRKTRVVVEILKGKTTVAEVARAHDLTPGEVQRWVDEGISGMENRFRSRPRDIREEYERKLTEAHAVLGEKELELKALRKWRRLLDEEDSS